MSPEGRIGASALAIGMHRPRSEGAVGNELRSRWNKCSTNIVAEQTFYVKSMLRSEVEGFSIGITWCGRDRIAAFRNELRA